MSKLLGDRFRVLLDAVEVCNGGNQLEILLSSEMGSMDLVMVKFGSVWFLALYWLNPELNPQFSSGSLPEP
jgi:hypothetical protein